MAGYVIADVQVHDPDGYAEYRRLVPATIERHGGRFLVRAGEVEQLEGDWHPNRLVILEFPSVEAARAWYDSDEYQAVKELRDRYSTANVIVVAGA